MRPSAIAISTFMQPALSSWPYVEMQNFAPLCCGVASTKWRILKIHVTKIERNHSYITSAKGLGGSRKWSVLLTLSTVFMLT
jgi:hypothetical protein